MIQVGMSTSCTFPKQVDTAFRLAKAAGFDGIEIMVSTEAHTRQAAALRALSRKHALPVLAIHAPVLLYTQFVWGTDPEVKLQRAVELAADCDAPTVVVHPPFRWQGRYARRFEEIVGQLQRSSGVTLAVENMFPWKVRGHAAKAYLPGINPLEMEVDAVTLDFSHAALSGENALELAKAAGDRLSHVHLCDGQAPGPHDEMWDQHLLPGQGGQPVAETLEFLRESDWQGAVVAEVNTRKAKSEADRLRMLRDTNAFARRHLGQG